jgi:hypothetical protein
MSVLVLPVRIGAQFHMHDQSHVLLLAFIEELNSTAKSSIVSWIDQKGKRKNSLIIKNLKFLIKLIQ